LANTVKYARILWAQSEEVMTFKVVESSQDPGYFIVEQYDGLGKRRGSLTNPLPIPGKRAYLFPSKEAAESAAGIDPSQVGSVPI